MDIRSVPVEWQNGVMGLIFKKGDQRLCSNDRGITLLTFPGKGCALSLYQNDRGECNCDLNLRHQRKMMVVLFMQQWASWAVRLTIIRAFCRYKAYCMTKKHPVEGIPGIWGGIQSLDIFFQLIRCKDIFLRNY